MLVYSPRQPVAMLRRFSALLLLPLLGGCATATEVVVALRPATGIGYEVICTGACEEEWQRAQVWITTYSRFPLELVTDVILQTYPPPPDDDDRGFIVVREPIGGDEYAIRIAQTCTAMFMGCRPPTDREVEMAFLYYVEYGEDLVRGLPFDPDD